MSETYSTHVVNIIVLSGNLTGEISGRYMGVYILWYVGPLLGNDREMRSYTTAVTRQRFVYIKRE
jgi:hypothetical protein